MKNSDKDTKQKLIECAISIIGTQSTLRKLSIRDVTSQCGVSIAAISYHFGSMDSFLDAVWQEIVTVTKGRELRNYYDANKYLLQTRSGQTEFISGMIDYYSRVHESKDDYAVLRTRILFQNTFAPELHLSEPIFSGFLEEFTVFYEVCHTVDRHADKAQVYAWYCSTLFPLFVRATGIAGRGRLDALRDREAPDSIKARLIEYCKEALLRNLGLLPVKRSTTVKTQ